MWKYWSSTGKPDKDREAPRPQVALEHKDGGKYLKKAEYGRDGFENYLQILLNI